MKKRRLLMIAAVAALALLTGCGGESQYDKDFRNGVEKYQNGEPMTAGEAKAVKNFNDWREKQGEKTYDEWNR